MSLLHPASGSLAWTASMGAAGRLEPPPSAPMARSRPASGTWINVRGVSVSTDNPTTTSTGGPVREVPGSYGVPILGPLKDRLDFYWLEGHPAYYENRMKKYKSTVFRMNYVPIGPGFPDPRVIALLDQKSYRTLYDPEKVDKRDLLTGPFIASFDFFAGHRTGSFMDPAEEKHAVLKQFSFDMLKDSGRRFFPELHRAMAEITGEWDALFARDGKVPLKLDFVDERTFRFFVTAFVGVDPSAEVEGSLGPNGHRTMYTWLVGQVAPVTVIPPNWLAPFYELALHTFRPPFFLFKGTYEKLVAFFRAHTGPFLERAERELGLGREELLHNFIYIVGFNAWAILPTLFPAFWALVGKTSGEFQRELHAEVRRAMAEHGGINPRALAAMPLVESVVYEALRIDPPVRFQFARAKKDLVVESHEAAFRVRKGEVLAGFAPIACQDPVVFANPKEFEPKRFLGEGRELLKHVLWSNGPETEEPSLQNKMCSGKNFVVTLLQVMVAEVYAKYERLEISEDSQFITSLVTPSS